MSVQYSSKFLRCEAQINTFVRRKMHENIHITSKVFLNPIKKSLDSGVYMLNFSTEQIISGLHQRFNSNRAPLDQLR